MESITSHKNNLPKEARKTADSVFDRIYKFYFSKANKVVLNKHEEETRDRWDFAWKMLSSMYTRRQVTEAIMQKFSMSRSVAYDDVNHSMMLFGDPRNANKDAKRVLLEEWIVKGIKKAWDDQDLDAYERLLARYGKINGLELETDNELADMLKKLRPTALVFTMPVDQLKAEADNLISDVDFEDVK